MIRWTVSCALALILGVWLPPLRVNAAEPGAGGVGTRAFQHPNLFIPAVHETLGRTPTVLGERRHADLAALGTPVVSALYDVRAGRWGTLVLKAPLIPGRGNRLRWADLGAEGAASDDEVAGRTWTALRQALERWRPQLGADLDEVGAHPTVSVLANGTLVQVSAPRVVGGVPVRGSALTAAVSHGNLVLLGLQQWGDVPAPAAPAVTAERARSAVGEHLRPFVVDWFGAERLELIPLARGADAANVTPGKGYDYRLAWVLTAHVKGDVGSWEGLVDAASGELLALEDRNQYQSARTVVGGVYPASNDGTGTDSVEQPGYPMPYTDVEAGTSSVFATVGGGAGCQSGLIGTTLSGRYVRVADQCGAVDETSTGNLDLGTSGGTNCAVPPGHSPGDTHAARTTYYELNRIAEQARGYLPGNAWLNAPLTANVNIPGQCNAFWNGTSVNFLQAGFLCANTGELAGLIDHEWAHGLDNNAGDVNISRPAEAFGHAVTALRQRDSCIGRGLEPSSNCSGFGDPCLSCTGIEDLDFARHASGDPHDLSWVPAACPMQGARGPCGRLQHCESVIVAEAIWDLFARDLPITHGYDANTALEVATRLFYLAAPFVSDWYACTAGTAGCAGTGGYLNFLAADDDNGDIGDGTPHMTAIFNAFNRHGIACNTLAVLDSGCAGGPTTAPALTVTAQHQGAALSWTSVAGAVRYDVYRGEGIGGCNTGKARITQTTGLAFVDEGLLNGFVYHYTVVAVGSNESCRGLMSACQGVVPVPGPHIGSTGEPSLLLTTGDGDPVLDNCEVATARFTIENDGAVPLFNLRILDVAAVTDPATEFLTTFPTPVASSLQACETASGRFAFIPHGLPFDGTAEMLVTYTADGLPEPRTTLLHYAHAESDFPPRSSLTFGFEKDLEGWQIVEGIWTRATAGGGAAGSAFYVRSSSLLDLACDRVRSPLVMLSASSTLSLSTRYAIEPSAPGEDYDRANVGVVDDRGLRTTVSPDGGNLYTVPAGSFFGGCHLQNQPGWNGTNPSGTGFDASTWSARALNPGQTFTGAPVRLDVVYATDPVVALAGFQFDEVTLTDVGEHAPDVQADSCAGAPKVDVDIVKSDGQTTAAPSAPITYTLTVGNAGPVTLTGIEVHDALPAALLSPSFTPSAGVYDPATGEWSGLNLEPGGSVTLTLSATVAPDAVGTLTNTATVTPGPLVDTDPRNNTSSDVDALVDLIFKDGFEGGS
jgi:uncharacterized repeat protein (TIGR01451 family)